LGQDENDWALQEFGGAALGDARRTARLVELARQLARSPHCSFPQSLSPAELKAAYRFFSNENVDTDGILTAHVGQTLGRLQDVPVVLAIQDTTEYNLTHLRETDGLGYCSGGDVRGFLMHSMLAVTPEGLPLGVLGMKTWTRSPDELGKKKLRKKLPVEEKESVKWIEGVRHLNELAPRCPQTQFVTVCDREGDVYGLFAQERASGVHWLVRAAWNRNVAHPEKYLHDLIEAAPALGTTALFVPARDDAPARQVQLELRCAAVSIRPPDRVPAKERKNIEVYAVLATELNPPEPDKAIRWMLLTSVPTETVEDVIERLAWYARRWTIETWHRVLKSGCQIEARQFGDISRFVNATALFAVIAWRIMFVTMLSRLEADISCEVLLQKYEWQALYCRTHGNTRIPKKPPTLGEAALWIAKLGGYLARKNDPPPGATAMWRGFLALHEASQMFLIFSKNE